MPRKTYRSLRVFLGCHLTHGQSIDRYPRGFPRRGEVYWADLPPPHGRRPVLIVSNNAGNRTSNFVLAAPITTRPRAYPYSETVALDPDAPVDGTVVCSNLTSIPKTLLRDCKGQISTPDQAEIDRALHAALDLPS
ncbi:MAG: type II toxin-antitoxin system PemK/MazF family toxin [bacterium]|nr:type II toxin-antitoxin system PemK/MazF family toxin [bacterium]MDE0600569.1 type II toxin-antitoxin system PemK/MazF family toxin [bacterium]